MKGILKGITTSTFHMKKILKRSNAYRNPQFNGFRSFSSFFFLETDKYLVVIHIF